MSTYRTRILADHHAVSSTRHELDEFLRREGGLEDDVIRETVALVFTELAANVVDHTASTWIGIAATPAVDGITLDVSHDGERDAIPPIESWESLEPGPDDPGRGHGLRLIRRLTSTITIEELGDRVRVRCVIPIS